MTDLEKLIAAVEAGTASADDFGATFPHAHHFEHTHAWGAYEGSLDAAKRLHDALLPGWIYNLAPSFCHVFPATDNGDQDASTGQSDQPARAWLLAILRGYLPKPNKRHENVYRTQKRQDGYGSHPAPEPGRPYWRGCAVSAGRQSIPQSIRKSGTLEVR